jgi:hypothetical protein
MGWLGHPQPMGVAVHHPQSLGEATAAPKGCLRWRATNPVPREATPKEYLAAQMTATP